MSHLVSERAHLVSTEAMLLNLISGKLLSLNPLLPLDSSFIKDIGPITSNKGSIHINKEVTLPPQGGQLGILRPVPALSHR